MAASPQSLFDLAACYTPGCLGPTDNAQTLRIGLLLQIANAIAGDTICTFESGEGSPVGAVTPDFVGQLYDDTTSDSYWRATGLTSADWTEINPQPAAQGLVWGPNPETVDSIDGLNGAIEDAITTFLPTTAYTELSFGNPTAVTNGAIINSTALTSLEFRLLETVGASMEISTNSDLIDVTADSLTTIGDSFNIDSNPVLISVSLELLDSVATDFSISSNDLLETVAIPALASVGGTFSMETNPELVTLSLDSLVTVGSDFLASDNTLLANFSAPLWVPTDGTIIAVRAGSLTAESVNHILARCVAAGVTTCTIELNDGTNAAPTGQGATDKAALILAGNTVTTN